MPQVANPKRALFDWQRAVASEHGPESPTCRHILLTLSLDASASTLDAFPSIDRLALRTGLSRRAVINQLWNAEAEGWFKRSMLRGGGKRWRHSVYHLTIPNHITPDVGERRSLPKDQGGEPNDPSMVNVVHSNTVGTQFVPIEEDHSLEDVLEQSNGDNPRTRSRVTQTAFDQLIAGDAPWND